MFVLGYKNIHFDDFEIDQYGIWSQICINCHKKNFISHKIDDYPGSDVICGVKGCANEAEFYIDFIEKNVTYHKGTLTLSREDFISEYYNNDKLF